MISFLDQQESVFAAIVEPIFHVVRAAVVPAIHALGYRKPPACLLLALWRPAGTATPRLRHLLLAVVGQVIRLANARKSAMTVCCPLSEVPENDEQS